MLCIGWIDIHVSKTFKSETYRKYDLKKMKRLALLDRYGVIDERPMEMAQFVLQLFEELKPMAEMGRVTTSDIKGFLESLKIESKQTQMYSMFYDGEVIQRVQSMVAVFSCF